MCSGFVFLVSQSQFFTVDGFAGMDEVAVYSKDGQKQDINQGG